MLLGDKLPRRDWWHGISWAEPEYAEEYMIEYGKWWHKDELPYVFCILSGILRRFSRISRLLSQQEGQ